MVPAHPLIAVAVALGLLAGCGGGDDGGDVAAFCEAVEALRTEDPFAELDLATPEEMRDAFDTLAGGADEIASTAPGEAEVQARRYAAAVDALRDALAGAGYVPTRVDTLRYSAAVADYTDAASSVDNAADSIC